MFENMLLNNPDITGNIITYIFEEKHVSLFTSGVLHVF